MLDERSVREPDVKEDSGPRRGMFMCTTRAENKLVYRQTFCFAKFAKKSGCEMQFIGRNARFKNIYLKKCITFSEKAVINIFFS